VTKQAREEFEKWAIENLGFEPVDFKWYAEGDRYAWDRTQYPYQIWQDAAEAMQARLDAKDAELAALKAVMAASADAT
jgi:hypothetical protein